MIRVGDIVRIRGGRANWTVIEVAGDRAYLESFSAYTDPPAMVSDLTIVGTDDECPYCDGRGHTDHEDDDGMNHQQQCWYCEGTGISG